MRVKEAIKTCPNTAQEGKLDETREIQTKLYEIILSTRLSAAGKDESIAHFTFFFRSVPRNSTNNDNPRLAITRKDEKEMECMEITAQTAAVTK